MLIEFKAVVGPLTAALGLSLVVERVIEFLNNKFGATVLGEYNPKIPKTKDIRSKIAVIDDLVKSCQNTEQVEQEAEKHIATLSDPAADQESKKTASQALANCRKETEWVESVPVSVVAWEPASAPNRQRILFELAIQTLGFALGIFLAAGAKLGLFNIFITIKEYQIEPWLDYVFTGLLIGAGSGPIHVLIRFISERRIKVAPEELSSAEAKQKPSAADAAITPGADSPDREAAFRTADWVPIRYEGGVDRDKLQYVHRRRNNPDLIVYHHTAMSRSSTFEDVVRVIKSRKDKNGNPWLTGYHCVVTEDGGIHPFCRWDRYGSHAAGYNMRSLGISFNGNFETSPRDRFSNHDGRYGPCTPSTEQLRAGARIVALWSHVYGLTPSFGETGNIIPHKAIAPKACPGNMFPYQEFERLITYYFEKWQNSSVVIEEIKRFCDKPYLYI